MENRESNTPSSEPDVNNEAKANKTISKIKNKTPLTIPDPSTNIVDGKMRCAFYILKKKRYCRCDPANGMTYCVEHSYLLNGKDIERKRVACPLNPKHSCYEDQLDKHVRKCNARQSNVEPYFVKDINSGELDGRKVTEVKEKVSVNTIPMEELKTFITKVEQLYTEHCPLIEEEVYFHPVLKDEAQTPLYGAPALKHIKQQASLLGHMEELGLLQDNIRFIEFGSGKGGLSHWAQLALSHCKNCNFTLVDRGAVRYKLDRMHREENQGPNFERLRMDIQDLDLSRVPSIVQHAGPLVAMSKHLCGAATDLSINCLSRIRTSPLQKEPICSTEQENHDLNQSNIDNEKNDLNSEGQEKTGDKRMDTLESLAKKPKIDGSCGVLNKSWVKGVVIALCCHHRCEWQSYVGKDFMLQHGIKERDFKILTTMTSWRTCGTRSSTTQTEKHNAEHYNHDRYGTLKPEEREEIGRKCKLLIDIGRMKHMEKLGYNVSLKAYTSTDISLENIALIAIPRNTSNS
ncbi:unnamed protein product [Owenia fusiformis]|uniref:tRNA:m(4)X modification enzyme TRM13 n=1 Tax=Owenia fusiformis TaxID=6347 RepID=A0A8S4N3T3_OWEFU|nr:unnamed protein product [Owenia fusiformis]